MKHNNRRAYYNKLLPISQNTWRSDGSIDSSLEAQ